MTGSFFTIKFFKTKIITIIVATCFLALLVASISLAWVLDRNFKKNLDESARSSLSILAYSLAPAVSFSDQDGVEQLLASFKTSTDVVNATAYQLNNNKLTFIGEYSTNKKYRPSDDIKNYQTLFFIGEDYKLTLPIKVDNEIIGYVYQHSYFERLNDFHAEMLTILSMILSSCLVFTIIVSFKLQKTLLKPLSHLINTIQEIRYKKDYSIRVEGISEDEFSYLSMNFNHMLNEIQSQQTKQLLIEEQVRQLNLHLEDKVNARTIELEKNNQHLVKALDQLEESKTQLVEKEKMASLGGLVAGVAHEINTPVGIGVTAISHLNDMLNELDTKVKNKALSQKYLEKFIHNGLAGSKISLTNLTRAADLISSFKHIAVDQSTNSLRTLVLNEYLHDILLSLQPKFKMFDHTVTITCDENITIHSNAGAISQILTNLFMNTLIHGFQNIDNGNINITAKVNKNNIELHYDDDGCGMNQESLAKLFDPFFTTRRDNGGSGLGAHLTYNLVTQALHGTIKASSEEGKGLYFIMTFPVNLS